MSRSGHPAPTSARERALHLMLRHAEAREHAAAPRRGHVPHAPDIPASEGDHPAPLIEARPRQMPRRQPQQPHRRRPARARDMTEEELEQRRKRGPLTAGQIMDNVLRGLGSSPDQARLSLLWRHWETVMGTALAPLAHPLGHRDGILFVGADDAMTVQELHMQGEEILERVNAFMEKPFFRAVKVSLVLGKTELDGPLRRAAPFEEISPPLPRSAADGRYLDSMDPDSPVARAYASFAARRRP